MKQKLNIRIVIAVIAAAVLIGIVYNYFYPNGIPFFKTDEKIPWAKNIELRDTTKSKNQKEFFTSIPLQKKEYLSEAKIEVKKSTLQLINLSQTYKLFSSDSVIFIDARDKWDFADGHIPGALNIPYYNFEKNNSVLKTIAKKRTIVVYCGGDDCDASLSLAKQLQKLQYSMLYVFSGGWGEWKNSGYKIEKSTL